MNDFDLIVAVGSAALSLAALAYLTLRGAFAAQEDLDLSKTGVRALLALPAAFIARRRVLDRELEKKLEALEVLRVQSGGRFLDGATAAEVFAAKFVFPLLALPVFCALGAALRLPGGVVMLVALFFAALLYAWPETGLRQAALQRTSRFTRDLPMVLDVMRLVSQSGGDLYAAIRSAISVTDASPVREELSRAVNEVAIGSSLATALSNIGNRIATPEANAVFSTLAQSLEMGTSVSDNLQSASGLIRHSQRVKAQAKAQKAVVAMTFPLLLLILPGVFIVLFAPMFIQYANR